MTPGAGITAADEFSPKGKVRGARGPRRKDARTLPAHDPCHIAPDGTALCGTPVDPAALEDPHPVVECRPRGCTRCHACARAVEADKRAHLVAHAEYLLDGSGWRGRRTDPVPAMLGHGPCRTADGRGHVPGLTVAHDRDGLKLKAWHPGHHDGGHVLLTLTWRQAVDAIVDGPKAEQLGLGL